MRDLVHQVVQLEGKVYDLRNKLGRLALTALWDAVGVRHYRRACRCLRDLLAQAHQRELLARQLDQKGQGTHGARV